MVMIREYRPADDAATLWDLKQQFERELGQRTGGEQKTQRYQSKLDGAYRERYLQWAEECMAKENCILLAEVDGDVVGYVFVLPEQFAMIWDAAVLNELFVEQAHRGTDVATALMEEAIDTAQAQDLPLDRVVLDVDGDNERAKAFYSQFGFEHWGGLVARSL